ncbi:amidohydrolase family protein [Phenylobacterium sp.]|uniref:amidohydrolase family protein n=1 Tax=Phenylobacterium sp. TaxID=1871053 RepID=UPI002715868E|nr:amidohydrolase family protein [Phenylobacterium sp.]MDO8378846.1 amidohydrolase family protein [Phenylobacterium sp.]
MIAKLLLAAGLSLAALAAQAAEPSYVVYRGASLIDGTGAGPRPDMSILVKGERIEKVWANSELALKLPPDTKVVDVSGLYALPGLINSHEHLATPPVRAFAQAQLRRDLYGGITGVRDMADDLRLVGDLARETRIGAIPGPDIYYAALMAGPEFFDDPRTHAVTAGAVAGHAPWMQAIEAKTDLKLAVALARGTGASAIKIYADLPGERVKAITAEAHRQGVPVWAHGAVFPASPRQVLDAQVDAVSHVCMLAYQASKTLPRAYHNRAPVDFAAFANGDNPLMTKLFFQMKRQGTVLDATVLVYAGLDARAAANPKGPKPYCTADLASKLTNQALRAGVTISAGTDGFSEPDAAYPGLHDELELLVAKAGFTPLQAISAATLGGALSVTKDPDFGTLAPGKLANMVFVAQDPSADIRALRTVVLTVKRGVDYRRADYDPQSDAAARKEPQ